MLQVIRKREEGEGGYSESHISPRARVRVLSRRYQRGAGACMLQVRRERVSGSENARARERAAQTLSLSLSLVSTWDWRVYVAGEPQDIF